MYLCNSQTLKDTIKKPADDGQVHGQALIAAGIGMTNLDEKDLTGFALQSNVLKLRSFLNRSSNHGSREASPGDSDAIMKVVDHFCRFPPTNRQV